MAPNPDRELGEARASIDRGDALAALNRLDRARRGYVTQHDPEGLEHVLDMTQLVDVESDRARIGRENLRYAVKQNLRQQSRRDARRAKEPWEDPYPDLQAPTEHTGVHIGRGVKIAIGVGVLLGTAAVAALLILPWVFDEETKTVQLRLVNDGPETLTVRGCLSRACDTTWANRTLEPGQETDVDVDPESFVSLFEVDRSGRSDTCLPVRVHDGYLQLDAGEALVVRLSRATPCPGTTVLPRPGEQSPL